MSQKKVISAYDARRHLGELLNGVFYLGDEVTIERAGKPMAVIISAERHQSLSQLDQSSE